MTKDNHILGKFNLEGIPPAARGVPQIEVTFDVDANGILNVSAVDKGTGKQNKITITNDKGRLSQDEIERMVSEAEKYKAEDDANRNRIESKNALENYCYSLKGSLSGDDVAAKMDPADKTAVEGKIEETISWLDSNPDAEKEEYEEKQKELEGIAMPILQKMGGAAGGMPGGMPDMGGMPGGAPGGAPAAEDPAGGPTIEEID